MRIQVIIPITISPEKTSVSQQENRITTPSNELDQLELLAYRFFKLFAQYEAKLKAQDFVTPRGSSGKFSIDWNRFARDVIGPDFKSKLGKDVSSAVYLLEKPPKEQYYDDEHNAVSWRPVPNDDSSVDALFRHISRVRNNLFHGGKFSGTFPDTWDDPDRSRKLLNACLRVLECFRDTLDESNPAIL